MKTTLLRAIMPLVLVLTLVSCSSDSTEDVAAVAAGDTTAKTYTYTDEEMLLLDKINEYRESIGLNALQPVEHISYKSEEHNEYMIAKSEINHDFFQQRSQNIIAVLGASKVNENVAYNYSTPNSVLHAWLQSPGHKANIEGNFTHFGASIRIAANGDKYYTNIFVKK